MFGLAPPKSIALDEAVLSTLRPASPNEVRLAEGDDGDEGDPEIRLRRFAVGRAEGAAGDSQKNDPRPGEPPSDEGPPKEGDC